MKETVSTLRWYFGVVGFGGLYIYSTGLWSALTDTTPSALTSVAILFLNLLLCAGYVYFTYTLPEYLHTKRVWVLKTFIHISVGIYVVLNVINDISGPNPLGTWGLPSTLLLGFLFWSYLQRAVTRLSKGSK